MNSKITVNLIQSAPPQLIDRYETKHTCPPQTPFPTRFPDARSNRIIGVAINFYTLSKCVCACACDSTGDTRTGVPENTFLIVRHTIDRQTAVAGGVLVNASLHEIAPKPEIGAHRRFRFNALPPAGSAYFGTFYSRFFVVHRLFVPFVVYTFNALSCRLQSKQSNNTV